MNPIGRRAVLRGVSALGPAGVAEPLIMPTPTSAGDAIRIGPLLAKTGDVAEQTEYLANGASW